MCVDCRVGECRLIRCSLVLCSVQVAMAVWLSSFFILLSYCLAVLVVGSSIACIPCTGCFGSCRGRRLLRPDGRPLTLAWGVAVVTVLLAWASTIGIWFGYSPLSVCSNGPFYGTPPVRSVLTMRTWDGGFWCSRPCSDSSLVVAPTIEAVQRIVREASSVRVVGAGHSTTALQCADPGGVVLSLEGLCELGPITGGMHLRGESNVSVVTASAGCTISTVQRYLAEHGWQLKGYGDIMSQSIGGGLSTSLHGVYSSSFGDHLVSLVAVVGNGSKIVLDSEDPNLDAWVGALGELGVIVEVTLRVWPTHRVLCETHTSQLDEVVEAAGSNFTWFNGWSIEAGLAEYPSSYRLRTCKMLPVVGQPVSRGIYETRYAPFTRIATFAYVLTHTDPPPHTHTSQGVAPGLSHRNIWV